MEETRRKMRSNQIVSFRYSVEQVEDTSQVTGYIFVNTKENSEIIVFQAVNPMPRTEFMTRFAALETALNEVWFEIPQDVEYRPA